MSQAVVAFIRKRYRQSHESLFQVAEGLTAEQWTFRPTPRAHNIAFQVWHSARFFDYVQSTLAGLSSGRAPQPGPRQIWHAEGLARKWDLDPAILGEDESGYAMDDAAAAALRLPEGAVIMEYARRTSAAAQQAVDDLTDEQLLTLKVSGWAGELPVAAYLVEYLTHDEWVLGTIAALRRAQGLPRVFA